ncbi:MAG: alpha-(1-_3)-arabinofuranosyltransferase family protein [Patescibacteria group bacterium]
MYPYVWDVGYPWGIRSFTISNLLGFQLYTQLFGFLSAPVLQRLLIFFLISFKFFGFIKLANTFLSKRPASFLVYLLPCLLLGFNAFASLNQFTYFQLMYGAYLPWSLYYFIKIFDQDRLAFRDVAKYILLATFFSPINANPALSLTVFIPQALYIALNISRLSRVRIKNLLIFSLVMIMSSLWWLIPMFSYFRSLSADTFAPEKYFLATQVGSLFQNFRFIGQWGWYVSHFLRPYYPFSAYYDRPFVVVLTYLVVFAAFFEAIREGVKGELKSKKSYLFGLAIASLFLVGGARPPFGVAYKFIFDNFPLFKIFREPFTKFSEIYVLSISLLLFIFLTRVSLWSWGIKKTVIFSLIALGVIVSIKPAYFAEGVVSNWNGSVRSYRVNIPKYWKDFEGFAKNNLTGARILTTPRVTYGGAWNWPQGFTSADDIAGSFLNHDNNVLRMSLSSSSSANSFLNNVYQSLLKGTFPAKYLAVLGVDYLLQENDFDWRYTGGASSSPKKTMAALDSVLPRKEAFGNFSDKYLSEIPNGDPNLYVRDSLYAELRDEPGLVLYITPDYLKTVRIFSPLRLIYAKAEPSEYNDIVSSDNFAAKDVFTTDKLAVQSLEAALTDQKMGSVSVTVFTPGSPKEIKFTRINPTKYYISVNSAPRQFILQFIESFDPQWKLYQTKISGQSFLYGSAFLNERTFETIGLKEISGSRHFKSNGFANGWIIDPGSLSHSDLLTLNPDGTYNLNLILEFSAQRDLYLYLLILLIVVLFCLVYLMIWR